MFFQPHHTLAEKNDLKELELNPGHLVPQAATLVHGTSGVVLGVIRARVRTTYLRFGERSDFVVGRESLQGWNKKYSYEQNALAY